MYQGLACSKQGRSIRAIHTHRCDVESAVDHGWVNDIPPELVTQAQYSSEVA
jgi:hypothetical protein